jgi:hypothetical protein
MHIADLDQFNMLGAVVTRWHFTFNGFSNCMGDQNRSLKHISLRNEMAPWKSWGATSTIFAPNLCIIFLLSAEALLGMIIVQSRPKHELIALSDMPVLPLVASMTRVPFRRDPSVNAFSTMYLINRSLMDPVGLLSSNFAHTLSLTLMKLELVMQPDQDLGILMLNPLCSKMKMR